MVSKVNDADTEPKYVVQKQSGRAKVFKIVAALFCLLPQLSMPLLQLRNAVMEQYLKVVGKLGVRPIFFPINLIYDYVDVKKPTDSCFWLADNATNCQIRFTDDGESAGNWTTIAPDQSLLWTVLRYGPGGLNETNDLFIAVLAPRNGEMKKETSDEVTLFGQEAKAAQYISNRPVPYLDPSRAGPPEDKYNLVVELKAEKGNLKEFIGYRDYQDMDAYGAWYRYHSYGVFTAYDDNRFANMPGYGYGYYGTTIMDDTSIASILMNITRILGIIPGIWCVALWISYCRNYIMSHRVKSFKQLSGVSEDFIGIWINQYPFLLILCAETLYTLKFIPSLGVDLLVTQEADLLMRLGLTGLIWPFVLALKLIFHLLQRNINITPVYYFWSVLLVFEYLPKHIFLSYLAYYLETNVVDNINIQYDYEFGGAVLNKQNANMGWLEYDKGEFFMDRFLTGETLVFLAASSIVWAIVWSIISHVKKRELLNDKEEYYNSLFGKSFRGRLEVELHPSISKGKLSSAGLHRAGYILNHGVYVSLNGIDAITNLFRLLTFRPLMGKRISKGKFVPQECGQPGLSIELRDV